MTENQAECCGSCEKYVPGFGCTGTDRFCKLHIKFPPKPLPKKKIKQTTLIKTDTDLLVKAVQSLAGVCDYAQTRDNVGYNGSDTAFGHWLANVPREKWGEGNDLAAYKMLRKYKVQLMRGFKIDYAMIPKPLGEIESRQRRIQARGDMQLSDFYALDWSEPRRVNTNHGERDVRCIHIVKLPEPEEFWDLWNRDPDTIKKKGFSVTLRNGVWQVCWWVKPHDVIETEEAEEQDRKDREEQAKNFTFDPMILYDYQIPHAEKLAKALLEHTYAVDASSTGTGKTFSSLVACKNLGYKPFVICTKAGIPTWLKSIKILKMETLGIVNYALARAGKYKVYDRLLKSGPSKGFPKWKNVDCPYIIVEDNPKYTGKNYGPSKYEKKYIITFNLPKDGILIFDECHRTKNIGTINSQLIISAKNAGCKILMLSATIGESPLKMYGPSRVLEFWKEPWEFYTKFCKNYGCYKGRFGWEFDGGQYVMKQLHDEIFGNNKGSRMRVEELIAQGKFPESQIIFESYDVNSNAGKINKIYAELAKRIAELDRLKDDAKKRDNALGARQKARQAVELLKVPMMIEMVNDLVEEGHSVVVFVNYTDSLKALCDKLKTSCTIYGGNTGAQNERNRAQFHNNKKHVIICNVAAAGESIDLHDVHHQRSRVALITPDDNAQNLKQCLGRVHRAGGTRSQQRILFAANTIEETVCANCNAKIANIDALNDGDLKVV